VLTEVLFGIVLLGICGEHAPEVQLAHRLAITPGSGAIVCHFSHD
jgi:hypothetical protein